MRSILFTLLLSIAGGYASAQCNPVITPSGNTTFCDGDSVILNASLGDTYQWYFNGNLIGGAQNNSYVASATGNYTVETDSAGCVNMSPAISVTVNTIPPQPGPISGNTTICSNAVETYSVAIVPGATSYIWHKPFNIYQFEINDTVSVPMLTSVMGHSHDASSPASELTVAAMNECGISDTSLLPLSIYTPVMIGGMIHPWDLDITNTGSGYCPEYEPPYTRLRAHWHPETAGYSTVTSYQWYRNGVQMTGAGQEQTITRGGDYSVKVFCGPCVSIQSKGLVEQCLPRATIYPQDSISVCLDSNVVLSVVFDEDGFSGNNYDWYWYFNNTMVQGSHNAYTIPQIGTGRYEIKLWSSSCDLGNGHYSCEHSSGPKHLMVTVPQPLEVTQIDDTLFATPGYDTYQWFESGNILVGETQPKHTLLFDGFYTVEGVFMNGCIENSSPFDSDFMPPPPPPPPPPGNNPQEPGEEMTISPNPFTNNFVLSAKVAKGDDKATISITDATGRILFEKEVDAIDGVVNEKIDLGDASAIVGTIRLRSAGTLKTERFFKK